MFFFIRFSPKAGPASQPVFRLRDSGPMASEMTPLNHFSFRIYLSESSSMCILILFLPPPENTFPSNVSTSGFPSQADGDHWTCPRFARLLTWPFLRTCAVPFFMLLAFLPSHCSRRYCVGCLHVAEENCWVALFFFITVRTVDSPFLPSQRPRFQPPALLFFNRRPQRRERLPLALALGSFSSVCASTPFRPLN